MTHSSNCEKAMKQKLMIILGTMILALVQSASAKNHAYGQSVSGEKLLIDENISEDWDFLDKIQGIWLHSPITTEKFFHFHRLYHNITTVQLIDQHDNVNHSAEAEIISGGVGHNYVNIQFTSQPFRGIYYTVKIYGVPRWEGPFPETPSR